MTVRPAPAVPDLLSPEFAVDPHPTYAAMRRHGPAWWDEATACWYVVGYDEVDTLLRDPRLSARIGAGFLGAGAEAAADVLEFFGAWPMFSDPPEHTAVRRQVGSGHRPAAVRPLGERIASTVRRLLAACEPHDADLLRDVVQPLATSVTCDLLGIPGERREELLAWSSDIIAFIGVPVLDPERAPRARAAIGHLDAYLQAERERAGDGISTTPQLAGLLSLPAAEGRAMFAQILTGGIEPVVGCIGATLPHLVADGRAVAEDVASGRVRPEAVTEEARRFAAPFHFVPRSVVSPVEVAGERLEPGQRVALVVAAAHRDPRRFVDPDRFRLLAGESTDPRHLAFGAGHHFCLGAPLARMTITESVRALADWVVERDVRTIEAVREPAFGNTVGRRIGWGF